jgi:effector-binding domain-containing protein
MSLEVKFKTISPKQVLSATYHLKVGGLDQKIQETLSTMREMIEQQNVEQSGPPFGIYHGPINDQEDGPIEICLPVRGSVTGTEKIVLKQLFGGNAASVTLQGEQCEFPAILKGYDAVSEWIPANGYQKHGPPREVWHSGPGPEAKMEILWFVR